jgi:hypothetical protein
MEKDGGNAIPCAEFGGSHIADCIRQRAQSDRNAHEVSGGRETDMLELCKPSI